MYIPRHFELQDEAAVLQVLEDYGFALLVTAEDGVAEATHLPLIHDPEPPPRGRLLGHFARANGQRQQLEAAARDAREVLAVFQGPHSYVSPNDYGPGPATVPTWNNLAVHVYGVPKPMSTAEDVGALLHRLTGRHEAGRSNPWSPAELDPELMARKLRGVFAFEIAITRVQAKAKLSQNRTPAQAAHAAARLESVEDPVTRETGRRMRAVLEASS
ncbi:MAG: FMN-binding negative transcriptional regulator [Kiloniellales bacterium]|nr:FMN-binding negative transcriptional regulator [Kiloniellales bacterium]